MRPIAVDNMGVFENRWDREKDEKRQEFEAVFMNISPSELPHAEKDENSYGKMNPFGQYFSPKRKPPDIEHFAEKRIGGEDIARNEINPVMLQKHLRNAYMIY